MKGFAFLLTLFVFLYPIPYMLYPVQATADLGESRIHPASPLYFLKSVREALELKFAGTTHIKALRQIEFATRRIRETKSLSKTSHHDLIVPTLERYFWHMGELKEIVSLKDADMVRQVSDIVTYHMNVLQTIYSQISDPRARMSIRSAIHRLAEWDQQFIDKLNLLDQSSLAQKMAISKLSGCNFLSKEASSSALNEVERVVLTGRAKTCF